MNPDTVEMNEEIVTVVEGMIVARDESAEVEVEGEEVDVEEMDEEEVDSEEADEEEVVGEEVGEEVEG